MPIANVIPTSPQPADASLAVGRFEGFEDALATAAEGSGWSWTGTQALTAMKEMLSPRYSAIMSMSAYPESKGGIAPPLIRSQAAARAAVSKGPLRVAEEPIQVQFRRPVVS